MIGRARDFGLALWRWVDTRSGISNVLRYLFRHPVPPMLAGKAGWLYVFGTAAVAVFMLQVVTGVVLATTYVPSTESAHESLKFISNEAIMGDFIRGLHYFGASAMVVIVGLHLARVFLTASYKYPREINWLSGAVLFLLVFGLAFTGQLLRWDLDAVGTTLIAAEQAGRVPFIGQELARLLLAGETIGAATLTRFYTLHVFILPGAVFAVLGLHLYLVIHNGISRPPSADEPDDRVQAKQQYDEELRRSGKYYFPDVIWKEVLFALLVIGIVVALAAIYGGKMIGEPGDPTITHGNPRPDWYLRWLYAILAISPPNFEDLIILLVPLIGLTILFGIPFIGARGNPGVFRRPWAVGAVVVVVLGVSTLTYTGLEAPWAPAFDTRPLTAQELGVAEGPTLQGAGIFFMQGCQYCHAVDGKGGSRGPELTNVRSRLSEAQIRQRILAAPEGMPSYAGKLSEEQIQSIIAFLNRVDEMSDEQVAQ
jgi:ubiquinol-cytochrome c reductase cytochrome b subunit